MDETQFSQLHGWNQPPGYGGGLFGDPFAGPPALVNPTVLPTQGAGAAKGGFNLAELKNMVDRMGGLDGVISTMGKFQKFMGIMAQMAPLIKVFMGKAGAKAVAASADTAAPARRRSSGSRRPSGGARKQTKRSHRTAAVKPRH